MTRIDIFSGFLGAGKTTLIKKLIKEAYSGEKLVLIENEFGEIGVDGGFLKDAGIEITEMNSGCICCSLVGDFSKALAKVLSEYNPDRVLIEPSGVGKLSDVVKAVKSVEGAEFELGCLTTVVDAGKCKMYMKNFGEFFGDQIKNATAVVLSHTDTAKQFKIEEATALVRECNSEATIITTPWDMLDGKNILDAMEHKDTLADAVKELEKEHHHHHEHHHEHGECHCHDHEHEHHHEHGECHCHDHEHEHHHEHGECHCHDHEHEHHHEHGECHCHDHEYEHHHEHGECHCHDHEHEHHHEHGECHCHDHEHEHHHEHGDCHCHDHEHEHHHEHGECHCHDHEHEHDADCKCGCHGHSHHADEVFESFGVETAKRFSAEEILSALEAFAEDDSYGMILRAKGIVASTDGEWIHFDYVPGEPDIRRGSAGTIGRLCVIGSQLNKEKIKEVLGI